ncbi:sodium:solute symporter family protein [Desmospora activa]|uniref:SSS family solute:Na+ symporter/sodium/pantothenate symporter n=1 Tax=Desmospora activa DSM 45169 TaxID=1121389 RepID=A0A2T4Z8H5_9BACL|nr:sodium:solute symporter family protein [Desmospora activa]PTM58201.1 SSS family solute:Na+ symporter/sodium/pantothenate symporter [Desmospora activa DSM 45169]
MERLAFGGIDGIIILSVYAMIMLLTGWLAGRGRAKLHESLSEYFLAGKKLGLVALFFTLFATQYSGNNVIGYIPAAYRTGFSWLQSITFMTIIIGVYLLFAPRLYTLSRRRKFLTPADWIADRFRSNRVTILSIILMLWALCNYLLEQLVAIGQGVSGLTGGTIPYQWAVVAFIVVMLLYEWLGGMRAVAYTDVMQGIALMVGIFVLLTGALVLVGGNITTATQQIMEQQPEKVAVPPLETSINWFSMLLLVGFGAAVYPHAIQRIYAAESERSLKLSFARMAWMPLITTGLVFLIGILAIPLFPGLDKAGSEQLVGLLVNEVAGIHPFYYWMMVLLFGGIIAAIISTADSVLLSLSSMVSKDIYARFIRPDASDRKKILVGKVWGMIAVAVLLMIAWYPPATLYEIFVLKFEILIQVAPAFLLGLYWRRLAAGPVFWGMLAGALLAGMLTFTGYETVYGVHGGILGLLLNVLICVSGSFMVTQSAEERAVTDIIVGRVEPEASRDTGM